MENGPLRVADAETLRAFAHPLRLRILSDLSERGRSNVVGVAERLGEPANSVSYHLSILARHGLVVAAEPPEGATRRERWWQTGSTTGFAVDAVDDESRLRARMSAEPTCRFPPFPPDPTSPTKPTKPTIA